MSEEKYKAGFLKAEQDCRDYETKIQALQKENEILKEALIDIATHNTLDGEKYHNFNAAYNGVVEFAQLTIDYIEGKK